MNKRAANGIIIGIVIFSIIVLISISHSDKKHKDSIAVKSCIQQDGVEVKGRWGWVCIKRDVIIEPTSHSILDY